MKLDQRKHVRQDMTPTETCGAVPKNAVKHLITSKKYECSFSLPKK